MGVARVVAFATLIGCVLIGCEGEGDDASEVAGVECEVVGGLAGAGAKLEDMGLGAW